MMTETMTGLLKLGREYGAHNYHPLPVVAAEAEGAWVTDVEGRRYLDMLAAYSALNFGHRHQRLKSRFAAKAKLPSARNAQAWSWVWRGRLRAATCCSSKRIR